MSTASAQIVGSDTGSCSTLDIPAASALIHREAHCLDNRLWDAWIDLFTEDAIYWVPSWKDDGTPTSDPDTELSLIYYTARRRLEERVWRLQSGQSPASAQLPRTLHIISNIRFDDADPHVIESNVTTHVYLPRRRQTHVHFAAYRHIFRLEGRHWRIAFKKILLLNDYLPSSIDVYTI